MIAPKESSKQDFFFRKRPILHHTCETCSELPSSVSSMIQVNKLSFVLFLKFVTYINQYLFIFTIIQRNFVHLVSMPWKLDKSSWTDCICNYWIDLRMRPETDHQDTALSHIAGIGPLREINNAKFNYSCSNLIWL